MSALTPKSVALWGGALLTVLVVLGFVIIPFEIMPRSLARAFGSSQIEGACRAIDIESPPDLIEAGMRRRAFAYIAFIRNNAKDGELSAYLTTEAWRICLQIGEERLPREIERLVLAKGSDSTILAAIRSMTAHSSHLSYCAFVPQRSDPATAARIERACLALDAERGY